MDKAKAASGKSWIRAFCLVVLLSSGFVPLAQPYKVGAVPDSRNIGSTPKQTSGSPEFLFPWPAGDSWKFTGGPHVYVFPPPKDREPTEGSGLDFQPTNRCDPKQLDQSRVLAAAGGTIVYVHEDNVGGKVVRIDHGDGWQTWYLHLSAFDEAEANINSYVPRGFVIGHCGATGTGAGGIPHLHLELVRIVNGLETHPSWNNMTIDGWRIHSDCGADAPANCTDENHDGWVEKNGKKLNAYIGGDASRVAWVESSNSPISSLSANTQIGGNWEANTPKTGSTVTLDTVFLAANTSPAPNGSPIDFVNFTVWWEGTNSPGLKSGRWLPACPQGTTVQGNVYSCTMNLRNLKAPSGAVIWVSFDVYDQSGARHLSPNGERSFTWSPSTQAVLGTSIAVTPVSTFGPVPTVAFTPVGLTPATSNCTQPPTLASPANGSSWQQSQAITLSWNTTCPSAYSELTGGPYTQPITNGWQSGASLQIGQMWPGTYTWHVKGRDASGRETAWSDSWTFTIGDVSPTATSAPSSGSGSTDGITVLSVSSQTVQPGERFTPSVFVRVESGELRQDRGDMLRCSDANCDNDASKRFDAYPFVAVSGNVGAGQSYTFTFYSDNPMVAPTSPGSYTSHWRIWRAGQWAGPDIAITFTVAAPRSRPSTCSPGSDGIILYLNPDYNPEPGGCLFVTGDIPDLEAVGFDQSVNRIEFVGSYKGAKQLIIFRGKNYQDLCNSYWQSQNIRDCNSTAMSVQVRDFVSPTPIPTQAGTTFAGNVAPQALLDPASAGPVVDGSLASQWQSTDATGAAVGFSWPEPVTIQRIVVWDLTPGATPAMEGVLLAFSDGTVTDQIDMESLGNHCADITFPSRSVTWVKVIPSSGGPNHGFREVEIWATTGQQQSNNVCIVKRTTTPHPGAVSPPSVLAQSTPASTPAAGTNLVVSTDATRSSDGQAHGPDNPFLLVDESHFASITIEAGAYASVVPWNGSTGGAVHLLVDGDVRVDGVLSADGAGYRGGATVYGSANGNQGESLTGPGGQSGDANGGGGGGGPDDRGPGAGGGYGSPGQDAVTYFDRPVHGGQPYGDTQLTTLSLGSGGGSSGANSARLGAAGGAGGGAIAIEAKSIVVTGRISANGNPGQSVQIDPGAYQGGGGGSGGSILLRAQTVDVGDGLVTALGGDGGYGAFNGRAVPGGNGGYGRIWIESGTAYAGATNPPAGQGSYSPPATPTTPPLPTVTSTVTTSNTPAAGSPTAAPTTAATPVQFQSDALGGATIPVPANQQWFNTGITAPMNATFSWTITATGTVIIAGSDPGKGPEGEPSCKAADGWVAPGLPCWSLVGRFGTDGIPFSIGSGSQGEILTTSGSPLILYLSVNDELSAFDDNNGAWNVFVLLTPTNNAAVPSSTVTTTSGTASIPTETATSTETPTATLEPSVTTATSTATATIEPTATSTTLPPATFTPVPTSTSIPVPTATFTPFPTATFTPVPTSTFTPEPIATFTPIPTATFTPMPTETPMPTATATAVPASSPRISIDPVTGVPGTVVTVTGRGYQPGETVDIYWHSTRADGFILVTVVAESDGTFATSITIPEAERGTHRIIGLGHDSRQKPSRSFRILDAARNEALNGPTADAAATETSAETPTEPAQEEAQAPAIVPSDGAAVVDETSDTASEAPSVEETPVSEAPPSGDGAANEAPVSDQGNVETEPAPQDEVSQPAEETPTDVAPPPVDNGSTPPVTGGPVNVVSVTASSYAIYDAPMAFDGNPSTAWIEGATGTGEQEFITVQFTETTHITAIVITNGFAANDALESAFGAPAEIMVSTPDGNSTVLTLNRSLEPQRFEVDLTGDQLTFTIVSIIPGDILFDAIAISEIAFEGGPPASPTTDSSVPADDGSATVPDEQSVPVDESGTGDEQPILIDEGTPVSVEG